MVPPRLSPFVLPILWIATLTHWMGNVVWGICVFTCVYLHAHQNILIRAHGYGMPGYGQVRTGLNSSHWDSIMCTGILKCYVYTYTPIWLSCQVHLERWAHAHRCPLISHIKRCPSDTLITTRFDMCYSSPTYISAYHYLFWDQGCFKNTPLKGTSSRQKFCPKIYIFSGNAQFQTELRSTKRVARSGYLLLRPTLLISLPCASASQWIKPDVWAHAHSRSGVQCHLHIHESSSTTSVRTWLGGTALLSQGSQLIRVCEIEQSLPQFRSVCQTQFQPGLFTFQWRTAYILAPWPYAVQ